MNGGSGEGFVGEDERVLIVLSLCDLR